MLPRDSEYPPYRTGDEAISGLVSFMVTIPRQLWYQGAWMDSQFGMTQQRLWQQSGDVTIDEATEAASTAYIRITPMLGTIFLWAGVVDPQMPALACDGTEYERADYPALYDLLAAFQTGPDTFVTPDLRGRTTIGTGSGYGIGDTGGEVNHELTTSEMPNHVHTVDSTLPALAVAPGELPVLAPNILPTVTGSEGGGEPHNNMQPYMALEYWIVAV